ncbi:MAG: hypothetical protein O2954_21070, partial [bacterium]|nr:hypothetical protein [bacterium]
MLRLEIDGRPAESPAFLREGRALWGRLDTGGRPGRIHFVVYLNDTEVLHADIDVRPALLDYETHFQA